MLLPSARFLRLALVHLRGAFHDPRSDVHTAIPGRGANRAGTEERRLSVVPPRGGSGPQLRRRDPRGGPVCLRARAQPQAKGRRHRRVSRLGRPHRRGDPPRLLRLRRGIQRLFGHGGGRQRGPGGVPRRRPEQHPDDRSGRPPGERKRRPLPEEPARRPGLHVLHALRGKLLLRKAGVGPRHRAAGRLQGPGLPHDPAPLAETVPDRAPEKLRR
mmetsp:Transcript_4834/g.12440  ORF Transcript_4834/g.12440 Transcript_4834/m.12440 type:complete len:215 (+) Transcript_4834:38-682(+)